MTTYQQEGWSPDVRAYSYRFEAEPGTNSMFRRTARAKANRLNARHIARHQSANVVYRAEKRKRGPFGWHVVKRTKVWL